ncbi:MAG: DNA alkylation repair protein [Acidimicrobiales bacterium]|nr:DNA alkylation repair protein [Acidimicrobiales bacterium]MYA83720.1 DNA alkylation repair protein [Acidimicrobiales bacterium]MYB83024.1 DNA alkylation repair protein [Acidimicrobiales bacterium]MYH74153.1 DNA alkylation repair protein [Acidimicrobiales bacterium]MYI12104.1 DNA alkylation repair protein [Acidimicrobiales bacterium]
MSTLQDVMVQLRSAGTAQNRKVYARHGAAEPMFGVSYKDLGRIAKPLRTDHALAGDLWDSGNHDARVLALRVADASAMTKTRARRWLRDVDNYILAEALGGLLAQTRQARELSNEWRDSPSEWPASVGWFLVACTAEQRDIWSADELRTLMGQICAEIAERPNRVRHEMNAVLIAIGLRDGNLRRSVLKLAADIGPIQVDHGETGCKTPAIAPYIDRTLAHREKMAARRAAKAAANAKA